ncbi:MAG: GerMN domain-containing protein [Actinobacteria bacterium]|nr:GerMN domain-containing protein [Actinomycetota bacterium]
MKRLAALLLAAVLAGCAGDADSVGDASVRVYLLRDGGGTVRPVRRDVDEATSRAALNELLEVASSQEAGELGATSGIPEGSSVDVFSLEGDTATVALTTELGDDGLAQVVFTLTQFPSVRSVDIQGGTFSRATFESTYTPSILVESPLPFEAISSPLRATGTANTFEANFQYELTDSDGRVIAENFVTATSGTGTRGTFEFTVPFELDGDGTLIVFESSAKDGSGINIAEIPLRFES